jgi:hypothetical protein
MSKNHSEQQSESRHLADRRKTLYTIIVVLVIVGMVILGILAASTMLVPTQ